MKRTWIGLSIGAAFAAAAGSAYAGAFGIGTQTPATGNAFAGGEAEAEHERVVWTSPAAMTVLPQGRHVTVVGHALRPSFKFRNGGSAIHAVLGSGNGGDGGDWAFVPNGYFAMDLGSILSVG